MKSTDLRQLIAPSAIALAVCIGGWFMLVKPKLDEIATLDQVIKKHSGDSTNPLNQSSIESAAHRMSALKARVAEIDAFNKLASDSSRLYGLVMDLADQHKVQVHSLQPGGIATTKSSSTTGDAPPANATRLNMIVNGPYENMASFLDSVCELKTFIRPITVQIHPTGGAGETGVEVSFSCDVFQFTLANALTDFTSETSPTSEQLGESLK